MAWPIGRLWRVCMVGVGVGCAYVWRWRMVCYGVCMALGRRMYGVCRRWVCTVCRRWVYVCMALCGERCVYVVCIVL